jgi:hypothetical protein
VRVNIGKLKAQIELILIDKSSFEAEFRMMIVTIGEHGVPPVETKLMIEGLMSLAGL